MAIWGLMLPAGAETDPLSLTVYYHERPPYSHRPAGGEQVTGLLVEPVRAAARALGVAVTLTEVPAARQLALIEAGGPQACALGWFRQADREVFARFSRPIYRDRPTTVVHRADDPRFAAITDLDDLTAAPRVRVLLKRAYSYGPALDRLITALPEDSRITVSAENIAMVTLIARHRADFLFMAPEEAVFTLGQADLAERLALRQLSDMPAGETRHLMCTRSVPDGLIDRFDAWFAANLAIAWD